MVKHKGLSEQTRLTREQNRFPDLPEGTKLWARKNKNGLFHASDDFTAACGRAQLYYRSPHTYPAKGPHEVQYHGICDRCVRMGQTNNNHSEILQRIIDVLDEKSDHVVQLRAMIDRSEIEWDIVQDIAATVRHSALYQTDHLTITGYGKAARLARETNATGVN